MRSARSGPTQPTLYRRIGESLLQNTVQGQLGPALDRQVGTQSKESLSRRRQQTSDPPQIQSLSGYSDPPNDCGPTRSMRHLLPRRMHTRPIGSVGYLVACLREINPTFRREYAALQDCNTPSAIVLAPQRVLPP